jgi:hypothetical protein
MRKLAYLVPAIMLATATCTQAGILTYGITESKVSGSDMAGMEVTVTTHDGQSTTEVWQDQGGNKGGASNGAMWALEFDGTNTWYSNNLDDDLGFIDPNRLATWDFYAEKPVSSLTIDAYKGDIFFDILALWDDQGNETGFGNTAGSEAGWWQENSFTDDANSGVNFFGWEFSNPLEVNGSVSGDLFGSLTINFDNPETSWIETMTGLFSFGVDTDKGGLMSFNLKPVPEPATMMLFSAGLAGVYGASRRRKK